jgi:hypothetical protein
VDVVACRTFENTTVELDENCFVDCTFQDCVLEYRGGRLSFESCRITGCRYLFLDAALRTVEYLQALGLTTEALCGMAVSGPVQ